MNSVFNALNGNLMSMVGQLRNNPVQFLLQHHLNIPQEFANDPEGAIRHMVNSGQISRQQVDDAREYARRLGINI